MIVLCTHHLEGLGNPSSEHSDSEEDKKRRAEANGGDDAKGHATLQILYNNLCCQNFRADSIHLCGSGSRCEHSVRASLLRLVGACNVISSVSKTENISIQCLRSFLREKAEEQNE